VENDQVAVGWGDFVDTGLGVGDVPEVDVEPEEDEPDSLEDEAEDEAAAGVSLEDDAADVSAACLPRLSLR